MRLIYRAASVTAVVALTAATAACSGTSGGSSSGSSSGSAAGQPQPGGTVTQAWVGATPNFIFPFAPATNSDGYNQNLTEPLWPPLAFDGDGGQSVVSQQESLYSALGFSTRTGTTTFPVPSPPTCAASLSPARTPS
jgi:peptide/nickel transport system substrate-binding protein